MNAPIGSMPLRSQLPLCRTEEKRLSQKRVLLHFANISDPNYVSFLHCDANVSPTVRVQNFNL